MAIVPLIEWMRDIQTHATLGLNAQLEQVPRNPDHPPPDPVTIVNELDDDWVGRDIIPRQMLLDEDFDPTPLLQIRMHPDPSGFPVHLLPEFQQNDPNIYPLILMYARRFVVKDGSTNTIAGFRRDARQTIRTAQRVIAQQFESAFTAITRGGCIISLPPTGIVLDSKFVEPVDDLIIDTLIAPFRIHDPWALGL